MIDYTDVSDYLDSLCPGNSRIIEELRAEAEAGAIPIIRRDCESLLRVLLHMQMPRRLLEVGTATGYSAIVMASTGYVEHIDTVEIGETDYRLALRNIERAGLTDRIDCHLIDASVYLPELIRAGEVDDMVFMDAAKAQYLTWLPLIRLYVVATS